MKVTRLGRVRPVQTVGSLSGGGGTIEGGSGGTGGGFGFPPGSGTVPTASGSNSWAWASNVARITSNSSNILVGPFVNFQSGSGIAFAAASNTLTISASGSASTLPFYNLRTDFGAACDNSTDDTAAVNAAIAAMLANTDGKRRCLVPYMTKITSDITLPDVDYADAEAISIEFFGASPPSAVPSVIGTTPLNTGPGFRTTDTAGAMFTGTSAGGLDNFTNIRFVLRNLIIRTPADPGIIAIDALKFANLQLEHVQVDAGSLSIASIASQATATSYGIRMPRVNNGATNLLRDVNVIGFYNGIRVGEHADIDHVFVWASRKPWVFEGSYHDNIVKRAGWYHCKQGIEFVAGPYTNESYFTWANCNVERAASGTWTQTADDVVDSSNYGKGDIRWHAVLAGTGTVHTFTKTGGTDVDVLEIGENPFGSGTASPLTTKGDLWSYTTTDARFAVGSNGTGIVANSSNSTYGMQWSLNPIAGELLMQDGVSSPPVPLETEDGSDWLYADLI